MNEEHDANEPAVGTSETSGNDALDSKPADQKDTAVVENNDAYNYAGINLL